MLAADKVLIVGDFNIQVDNEKDALGSSFKDILKSICHVSGYHSLQLHITHGLHLPSCTAHTHSRPPLHQSHSCHHSLISLDCLPTPAPHSHTHI